MNDQQLQVVTPQPIAPLSVSDVLNQVKLIQDIMHKAMKKDEHYGVIPGTNKPSLLKAGAEKLCLTFRMSPAFTVDERTLAREHREYRVTCRLTSIGGQSFLGEGVGCCSTMESKYRYRKADLTCPDCGKPTIIKGKVEFGGGWLCYAKKGGCGQKWTDEDNPFGGISLDKVEHDNPSDYCNTILKMAKKRALVDAILTVTAASDIFTQDVEEIAEELRHEEQRTEKPKTSPPSRPASPLARQEQPNGDLVLESFVKDVQTVKNREYDPSKKLGGKNWKERFGILLEDDPEGRTFGSFDAKIAACATRALDQALKVTARVSHTGKYWNIEAMEIAGEHQAAPDDDLPQDYDAAQGK